jgi:hypothetical protein
MKYRTSPVIFAAAAALLFALPSYAQERPPSAPPPPPSAHKSFLKAPGKASGSLTVTEVPGSTAPAGDIKEAPRTDNKFLK